MLKGRFEEVDINLIDLGDRARKTYEGLEEFAKEIQEHGLYHNLVLYQKPEPNGELPYLILAGGRRYKTLKDILKWEKVPCKIYDQILTELQIKAIELAENFHRKNLSPVEEVSLVKEIHELQVKIYGKKTSTSPNAPGHSLRNTATMLGVSHASLSQDIKVAKAIEQFPELQWDRFKNKNEMAKTLAKLENSVCRMIKAEEVDKEIGTGDNLKRRLIDSYIIGDFFDLVERLPDGSMNLVEMDPPYGIELESQKKNYGYDGYNEVKAIEYLHFLDDVFNLLFKKMSTNSWLICWFGIEWYDKVIYSLKSAKFNPCPILAIWFKGAIPEGQTIERAVTGQTNTPLTRLGSSYETFIYASKGNPVLAKPGTFNVFSHKPVSPAKKTHPTERPLDLMKSVLTTFGQEGDRLLIPFAGSGVSLIAAGQLKMIPIGFDLTQTYKDAFTIRVSSCF
jgi:site-specific DNA-methyltransferase (adenine-specific)